MNFLGSFLHPMTDCSSKCLCFSILLMFDIPIVLKYVQLHADEDVKFGMNSRWISDLIGLWQRRLPVQQ